MNFESKWLRMSAGFMAVSCFLLIVYYLGISNLADIGLVEQILNLWLPVIIGSAFIAMTQMLRLNTPGLYAIIGAALCVMLICSLFVAGGIVRIILGTIWYILCGLVLLMAAGGYLPSTAPASVCFAVAGIGRVLFALFSAPSLAALVSEFANLSIVVSLLFLPMGMDKVKKKELS